MMDTKQNFGSRIIDATKAFGKALVKQEKNLDSSKLIKAMSGRGYSYMGNSFCKLRDLVVSYDTFMRLQAFNTEAQKSKDLIVEMVGKKGIQFKKGKNLMIDRKREKIIKSVFGDPLDNGSFITFKDKFYTNSFCSGMVNASIGGYLNGDPVIQVLDSRYVSKRMNNLGQTVEVFYGGDKLSLNKFFSQLIKYDPDRPGYGMSIYQTVLYDAMSDYEASRRNYFFFKNNAMPTVILTMEDDIQNEDEVNEAIAQFEEKYGGSENSNRVFATGGIKEVRTVDFTNKDLELLQLKTFSIKKMGVVFGFDPRFIAFRDGENGSHSEYALMATQSDKKMQNYSEQLQYFMLNLINIIYDDFPYDEIVLVNDKFIDAMTKVEIAVKEVNGGIISPAEARDYLEHPVNDLPEAMSKYYINEQRMNMEDKIEKDKASIKKTSEESKKISAETKNVGKEKKVEVKEEVDETLPKKTATKTTAKKK